MTKEAALELLCTLQRSEMQDHTIQRLIWSGLQIDDMLMVTSLNQAIVIETQINDPYDHSIWWIVSSMGLMRFAEWGDRRTISAFMDATRRKHV